MNATKIPAYVYVLANHRPPQPPIRSNGPSYQCTTREELARLCQRPKRKAA